MIPKEFNKITVGDFFGKLFTSRDTAHLIHLKISGSSSYAAHKALNDYYDEILDLIDGLVESYQGKYGIVDISIEKSTTKEPITHLEDLARYIEVQRSKLFKDSFIDNQIDSILELIYSTIYKLKFLK